MRPWLLLCLAVPAHAGVTINEVLYNPTSTDTGNEWIELYNDGGSPVDISGWQIERGKSGATPYAVRYTVPATTSIAAGGFLVIGEADVSFADLNSSGSLDLGNGDDAVRLLDDSSGVVDTVVYGGSNGDGWLDDAGATAAAAPSAPEGSTIARKTDGGDTDDSSADFKVATTPTPGATNYEAPACDVAGSVVINELLPDPDGSDSDGTEWVELLNTGSTELDVSGYRIAAGTATFSSVGSIPSGTKIAPGAFLVVGQSTLSEVDVIAEGAFSLGNATTSSDGVRLEDCEQTPLDTVIYGEDNSVDNWVDDTGSIATSMAPKPSSGQSLARVEDGVDTDLSGDDFTSGAPTPGLANDSAPPDCGAPGSGLVVNELLTNPAGDDTGFEFIELYHAGSGTLDLEGWAVQDFSSSWGNVFTFEAGTTMDPGDYLVLGGASVPEADVLFTGTLPNGTDGDGIRVVDCSGYVADTLVFGPPNDDEVNDDLGLAESLAPKPGDDQVLARISDGYDTDDCGVDFALHGDATPGSANPEIEPIVCVPSTGDVVLNEALTNPSGSDDGLEWIELYNRGSSEVSVAGWWIASATNVDNLETPEVSLPGGVTIPAGGFLVIGGELVEEADVVAPFSLGNGTGGDALRLYDCDDNRVDTVVYGSNNEDLLPDDSGVPAEELVPNPSEDTSIARIEDGVDSDAAADWFIDLSPTPGATNYQEPGDTSDGPGGSGCNKNKAPGNDEPGGCGGGPPDAMDGSYSEPASCTTLPLPFGGTELFAVLVVLWRRREDA